MKILYSGQFTIVGIFDPLNKVHDDLFILLVDVFLGI